jgi:hypothetical protein
MQTNTMLPMQKGFWTMSLDFMLNEIQKREAAKEQLFNRLLKDCHSILQKIEHFKDSPTSFHPSLPSGVVGRRLPDKITFLEKVVFHAEKIEKATLEDLKKIQKALILVIQHLSVHKDIFPLEEDLLMPSIFDELQNEFAILASIESNLKTRYIEFCAEELKRKATKTSDKALRLELKQTYDFYTQMAIHMSHHFILRLKSLNEEYRDILSSTRIAREYKTLEETFFQVKERHENLKKRREQFKESAKHLTHLEKCQKKAANYQDEIEKHFKKLDTASSDAQLEIEELISSYQEAYKIMDEEIERIRQLIQKEYQIEDVEDYHKKSMGTQVEIANTEMECASLEKRISLLEQILDDIHRFKKKSSSSNED